MPSYRKSLLSCGVGWRLGGAAYLFALVVAQRLAIERRDVGIVAEQSGRDKQSSAFCERASANPLIPDRGPAHEAVAGSPRMGWLDIALSYSIPGGYIQDQLAALDGCDLFAVCAAPNALPRTVDGGGK